jgi:hypothetical protein
MTVTFVDMLRAALPAVGSFGAVYLALRFRTVGPAAAPTRKEHLTVPADGTRIELIIDRPLYGPSVIHINATGHRPYTSSQRRSPDSRRRSSPLSRLKTPTVLLGFFPFDRRRSCALEMAVRHGEGL